MPYIYTYSSDIIFSHTDLTYRSVIFIYVTYYF